MVANKPSKILPKMETAVDKNSSSLDKALSLDEKAQLKIRILNCQSSLPSNSPELINELFPEFEKAKVRNVKNALIADERLTEIFESLAAKYTRLKAELKEEFTIEHAKAS